MINRFIFFTLYLALMGQMTSVWSQESADPHIYILVGPSGVGKSTLMKRFHQEVRNHDLEKRVGKIVSTTTRAKRPNEEEGVDYFYLNKEDFLAKKEQGDFVTHMEFAGNHYGLSKESLLSIIAEKKMAMIDLEPVTAVKVKAMYPDVVTTIFVSPPTIMELERRLKGRGTENETSLKVRMESAEKVLACQENFDHKIISEDEENTWKKILSLLAFDL